MISLRELIEYIAGILALRRRIIGLGDSLSRALARIMEFVPGKPMSVDNYRSTKVHSICDSNGFASLGIEPTPMEAVVPRYLAQDYERARLSDLRRDHG